MFTRVSHTITYDLITLIEEKALNLKKPYRSWAAENKKGFREWFYRDQMLKSSDKYPDSFRLLDSYFFVLAGVKVRDSLIRAGEG